MLNNGTKIFPIVLLAAAMLIGCKSNTSTQPENDTTPPTITITSPVNNSNVSDSVLITIDASDDKKVSKVEIYIDGVLVCTRSVAPWQYQWKIDTLPANTTHPIVAMAYDAANNKGWSDAVRVNVLSNIDYFPIVAGNRWVYDYYSGTSYTGGYIVDRGTTTWEVASIDSSTWPHSITIVVNESGTEVRWTPITQPDTTVYDRERNMSLLEDARGYLTFSPLNVNIACFRYNDAQPGDTIVLHPDASQTITLLKEVGMERYERRPPPTNTSYYQGMFLREYHLK